MYCKHCGSAISDSAVSCDFCGAAVPAQADAEQVEATVGQSETNTGTTENQQNTYTQNSAESYQQVNAMPSQAAAVTPKRENMITGIVGALIGAAIGAAVIVLLGQLGYVASISGLILAVCTLKGYELLGHQLSIKGAIICLVLILITPYFADRLDWALWLSREFSAEGVTLGEAYAAIPGLIAEGLISKADYIKSLVMIYIFAALGAFGTVRDLFRK